jgi:hypothetical protein
MMDDDGWWGMKTGLRFFLMATGRDDADQQVYADALELASTAEGLVRVEVLP